ncbi:MAG: hypothetical protein R3B97_03335 [Dehalococcoidia bacterium]|nr:hypothetical protein [Dehalococcoidia bacterium]MCB9485026.1 hypothetical protein [Thermoflexaceae bacterium]
MAHSTHTGPVPTRPPPVDRLLSSTLELDEINSGFDYRQEGSAIRQVVLV